MPGRKPPTKLEESHSRMHAQTPAMAQEIPESSVAISSTAPGAKWWHFSSSSSGAAVAAWSAVNWPRQPLVHRSLMGEADMSVSGTSTTSFTDHLTLSTDGGGSPSAEYLSGEPAENHMYWTRDLLNVEAEVQNGHGDGTRRQQMLDPAVRDYLKHVEQSSSWKLNPSSVDCTSGQTNYRLSDLVSNWSIAPPKSNLNTWMDHLQRSRRDLHAKTEVNPLNPPSYPNINDLMMGENSSTSCFFSTSHEQESETAARGQMIGIGDLCAGIAELTNPWSRRRNSSDQISFGGCSSSRQASTNASDLCDGNKHGHESSTTARNGTRIPAQGKKKRSEDRSESLKKSKCDGLLASDQKVPKVMIAEKMSALQELVSPFGKTDQASVLMETITCIKMLQEQVQLLTDPYLKPSPRKDLNSWVNQMERKEKTEADHELRRRGLCLVPVSSIPQVHRERSTPDYWMPTHRSCLYR